MPPGPASPASMPRIRNTSRSGAPNRIATRLDRMPASTSSAPSRKVIATVSREVIALDDLLIWRRPARWHDAGGPQSAKWIVGRNRFIALLAEAEGIARFGEADGA